MSEVRGACGCPVGFAGVIRHGPYCSKLGNQRPISSRERDRAAMREMLVENEATGGLRFAAESLAVDIGGDHALVARLNDAALDAWVYVARQHGWRAGG